MLSSVFEWSKLYIINHISSEEAAIGPGLPVAKALFRDLYACRCYLGYQPKKSRLVGMDLEHLS